MNNLPTFAEAGKRQPLVLHPPFEPQHRMRVGCGSLWVDKVCSSSTAIPVELMVYDNFGTFWVPSTSGIGPVEGPLQTAVRGKFVADWRVDP